jgi:CDP-diglyceride synthetase
MVYHIFTVHTFTSANSIVWVVRLTDHSYLSYIIYLYIIFYTSLYRNIFIIIIFMAILLINDMPNSFINKTLNDSLTGV